MCLAQNFLYILYWAIFSLYRKGSFGINCLLLKYSYTYSYVSSCFHQWCCHQEQFMYKVADITSETAAGPLWHHWPDSAFRSTCTCSVAQDRCRGTCKRPTKHQTPERYLLTARVKTEIKFWIDPTWSHSTRVMNQKRRYDEPIEIGFSTASPSYECILIWTSLLQVNHTLFAYTVHCFVL